MCWAKRCPRSPTTRWDTTTFPKAPSPSTAMPIAIGRRSRKSRRKVPQNWRNSKNALLALYDALRDIPTLALRADFKLVPVLLSRYLPALIKLLPQLGAVQSSVADLMRDLHDPWLRRLIDLECFLLSGLKAEGTIAPEVAFMFGERTRSGH